jgi:adenine-specific DNA-methyltransferase
MAKKPLEIDTLAHKAAKRRNIPTAEFESVMRADEKTPIRLAYERRNRDLDPQLVWRGKDVEDWSDLIVAAPPLYIQEKVHPKVIIDDLVRQSRRPSSRGAQRRGDPDGAGSLRSARDDGREAARGDDQPDLFADFNGLKDAEAATEFYQHDQNWSNRMIVGDSLAVMASLAEREGLRGQVQCIYLDPPYGIKFNSNFQWSTTSRDVKDGDRTHVTREPEQVRAFRDTWRDGIHSYLTYLRDRLTVARDLLHESGSIFVQIGDENVHHVRELMDEIFGAANFCSFITVAKTTGAGSPAIGTKVLASINDYIVWYAKDAVKVKYRQLYLEREFGAGGSTQYTLLESEDSVDVRSMTADEKDSPASIPEGWRIMAHDNFTSQTGVESTQRPVPWAGKHYTPGKGGWKTNELGARRLSLACRLLPIGNTLRYRRKFLDFAGLPINNSWLDFRTSGFSDTKVYVVQTNPGIVARCILMTSDPGDLVLDPTCGSGTTAYVAEQWGRRWITIDTSRVAIALARSRLMGARYPYYLLADSPEGRKKEWQVAGGQWSETLAGHQPLTTGNLKFGFVYERVPHITLKSIANNAEIDVIWERFQAELEPLRAALNAALGRSASPSLRAEGEAIHSAGSVPGSGSPRGSAPRDDDSAEWQEWEIPREADAKWPDKVKALHKAWWDKRIARQKAIDASIAAKAEFEYLYDKPYVDTSKVRVAGPFTVESLSPHRTLAVDWDDELIDVLEAAEGKRREKAQGMGRDEAASDFAQMILENLKVAGVQQAHKEGRITFLSLTGWPGRFICAEGTFMEGEAQRRAGILIGPEFGTVARPDLVAAAREAGDAGFDVLIACAFNFDAHSAEFDKLGRVPVLKARMNPDLHMGGDLKATGSGNLFVIFGEPDIAVVSGQWLVTSRGRMVVSHERIAQLSGLGSLEEINRLGGSDLPRFKRVAAGREIWADESGQAGSGFDSSQHRRRGGAAREGGVSALSRGGEGVARGGGDASADRREAGLSHPGGAAAVAGGSIGNRSHALRPHEITAIESLTPADFPLTLTTDHWSQVTVFGVDVFKPQTGEVVSEGTDGIALWMLDTDYNEESFFVRHAYFLGANDPYKALKVTLKAEIDQDAWESLRSDTSRPFPKPASGRIAVKVINHLGDEVMKVFSVRQAVRH